MKNSFKDFDKQAKKEMFGFAGAGCLWILFVMALNLAFWGGMIYLAFYFFDKFFM